MPSRADLSPATPCQCAAPSRHCLLHRWSAHAQRYPRGPRPAPPAARKNREIRSFSNIPPAKIICGCYNHFFLTRCAVFRPWFVARLLNFWGTVVLVFAETGAIVFDSVNSSKIGHIGIALTFGLVVMTMVYTVGNVSGAHWNPAVTLGLWVAQRIPRRDVLPFIAAQVAGALRASLLLFTMFPHHPTPGATIPFGPPWHSFILEVILEVGLTGVLVWVILEMPVTEPVVRALSGIVVGGVIALEALFAGPISGASMNPTRSLAPALVSGNLKDLWIYMAARILGTLFAVPVCGSIRPTGCCCSGGVGL